MALGRKKAEPVDRLVVGLGNPGSQYARTPHNIGFLVVEELARRHGASKPARLFSGKYAAASIAGQRTGLLMPTTFVNDSGRSVQAALRELKLGREDLLLVHDHIDLPFGQLRLRAGGGHGGHNGLKSIMGLIGPDFARLRIGVDRPPSTDPDVVAEYVLSPFPEPWPQFEALISRAVAVVESWVRDGLEAAAEGMAGPSRSDEL